MNCNKYILSSRDPQRKFESIVSIVKIDTIYFLRMYLFACLSVRLSLCVFRVYVCVRVYACVRARHN